jgi:DNA adenine methylase
MIFRTASKQTFCNAAVPERRPRPFVKWVGGKSQLWAEIQKRIPENYKSYFEPFVGGGAVFFNEQPSRAILIDINYELVNAYQVIRDEVDALIRDLQKHEHSEDYFYRIRNIDRERAYAKWSPIKRASRLIYLNKTCYNGLYRVNSKGHFNTPFGRYDTPNFVDEENLRACSAALQGVEILENTFFVTEDLTTKGDFVYFDPPYMPLSKTANFTGYAKDGFSEEKQTVLRDLCVALDRKGVKFMLSNSDVPFIRKLYKAFNLEKVLASRAINSNGSKRGKISEVLITNY